MCKDVGRRQDSKASRTSFCLKLQCEARRWSMGFNTAVRIARRLEAKAKKADDTSSVFKQKDPVCFRGGGYEASVVGLAHFMFYGSQYTYHI